MPGISEITFGNWSDIAEVMIVVLLLGIGG